MESKQVFSLISELFSKMFSSLARQTMSLGRQISKNRAVCRFSQCKVLPNTSLHTGNFLCYGQEEKEKSQLGLQGDNLVQRLYNKMFGGRVPLTKLKASGYILLTHCAQRTELIKFFETFDMPDTFYSWFLVTELHVWLLGVRSVMGFVCFCHDDEIFLSAD